MVRILIALFVVLLMFGCAQQRGVYSTVASPNIEEAYPASPPPAPAPAPPSPPPPEPYSETDELVEAESFEQLGKPATYKSTLDSLQSQLYSASIAFVVPPKANIEDKVNVQLLIDPNVVSSELMKQLTSDGEQYSGNIKVSKLVQAKLIASGFDVSNVTPETQPITVDGSTEWIWLLTPKEVGTQKLYLTINAIVEVDGKENLRQIKTYEKELSIEISRKQKFKRWFDGNWQWAWGAIAAPIIGLLWAQTRKKKKKR